MTKEYREFLKKHDPIAYSELMADPVTGLNTDYSSNVRGVVTVAVLFTVGVAVGVLIGLNI